MKITIKVKIIVISVVILSVFNIFLYNIYKNENISHQFGEENNYFNLKTASYWNLTGNPIFIDDTQVGTYDWATINATYDWCTGSGTQADPYILENITIDGLNSGNCIEIWYSSVYFIIRNCTLYNSGEWDAGMYLNYVNNAKIVNNTLRNNYDGIFFQGDGDYHNVSYNRIKSNTHEGIRFESFHDYCNITQNIVINNQALGIILRQDCTNNLISDNIVINNTNVGIQLQGGSNNNTVQGNIVKDSTWYGIILQGVEENRIKRNIISNNDNYGIVIHESNNNTILENNISNNSIAGIDFQTTFVNFAEYNKIIKNNITDNGALGISVDTYSKNNTFFQNNFRNNFKHAWDDGSNNTWDSGAIGNYWDDYSGADIDDDGIGNTPYTDIGGTVGAQDNFPIWWDPPKFSIISPSATEQFGDIAPNYTIYIDGGYNDKMWYTIDNGLTNQTFTSLTGTINQSLWNNTAKGFVTIRFYMSDSRGYISYEQVSIEKIRIEKYWYLDPFIIDDSGGGDYTWAEAVSFDWCSGNGTLVDPYIIEYIRIDGENSSSCLTIQNSNATFVIINNSFYNSGSGTFDGGIVLDQVKNGLIIANNCSFNNGNGIVLRYCQYIVITKNSINSNNISGVFLFNSDDNLIFDNDETINNNDLYGVFLLYSDYNNIYDNIINQNYYGVYLQESNYNNITNNDLFNNIIPYQVIGGTGNTIEDISFPDEPFEFPFEILIIILIIVIVAVGITGSVLVIKKRRSYSGVKAKEISEKKREKIRTKLEGKLDFVDYLIKERKIQLAYKNLGKIEDTAEKYDFFDIFNKAIKKVEQCKELEVGISKGMIIEETRKPTEEREVKKAVIPPPIIKKEEEKKYNLFISYSTVDRDYFQITKIVEELKKYPNISQISYWERDSKANIVEFMDETLEISNTFLLFCSEHSVNSKAVKDEWQAAFQMRKEGLIKLIPVYEEQKHIPKILWHLLNVKYDKDNFKAFIENLYNEIMREQ